MHGHKRAADGLKLMNSGDECGMMIVVKVFQSRKNSFYPENESARKDGKEGKEGRDGKRKQGRKDGEERLRDCGREKGKTGGRKRCQETKKTEKTQVFFFF